MPKTSGIRIRKGDKMVKLVEIDENNFLDFARLRVQEDQKHFLDSAGGILARGYAYRGNRAKVYGIMADGQAVGIALVKDMDEEPATYDLQQFLIDRDFQKRGYGAESLRQILTRLKAEQKYGCVEVCVNRSNLPAQKLFFAAGFEDTGYIDGNVPDCLNLMYYFEKESTDHPYTDAFITDFSNPLFQDAFRAYFAELGIPVKDWSGLFQEMNDEGGNTAFLRIAEDGSLIGFIQFRPIVFTSSFFEETCGFIREFYVAEKYRKKGCGTALLFMAENYFREKDIEISILTTDTAEDFYRKNGYEKLSGCKAKNQDAVFVKRIPQKSNRL